MASVIDNEDGTWSVQGKGEGVDLDGVPSSKLAWAINEALGRAFDLGASGARHSMRVVLGLRDAK